MAQRTKAQLGTDIDNIVENQTSPDAILPTTLDDVFQNIVDSTWNTEDGITVGDTTGSPALTIPATFNGLIDNGDNLSSIIQQLMNVIAAFDSNSDNIMSTQGVPGLFLATITESTKQTVKCTSALVTDVGFLAFPNDIADGGFDNGNNWNTHNYKVPAAGFTGRFGHSGIEVELVEAITGTGSITVTLQMVKNGANYGASASVSFADTDAVGTKKYMTTKLHPVPASSVDVNSANDVIAVKIQESAAIGVAGTVRFNKGIFANQNF